MPLRDHFRPPVEARHSWDELHGMWPAVIVQKLFPLLPEGYVAAPATYVVTVRGRKRPRRRSVLESWYDPMQVGGPLPTLPLWLDVGLNVPLDLEASYEEACRFLRIP